MRHAAVPFVFLALLALVRGPTTVDARVDDTPHRVLVKLRVPLTDEVLSSLSGGMGRVDGSWEEIGWFQTTATGAQAQALANDSRVAAVTADRAVQVGGGEAWDVSEPSPAASAPASTPLVPWHLDMADATESGFDGTGVTVAVVDSGLPQNWRDFLPEQRVDTDHAAGFGAMGQGTETAPLHPIVGEGGYFGVNSHGLAIASVILGSPSRFGLIRGAAPGAKVLPVRVINHFNWGWHSWFAAGIVYVANLKRIGAISGPVVINFSIQADPSDLLADAVDYALSQGVLFVTIAGNWGPAAGSISTPGRLPQAITVGMVGWVREASLDPSWIFDDVPEDDASEVYVPGISGRESDPPAAQTLIDVVAPGSVIYAASPLRAGYSDAHGSHLETDANFPWVGTSYAAPVVAGIVAQMLEKN